MVYFSNDRNDNVLDIENDKQESENRKIPAMEYGCLTQNAPSNAALVLSEVLFPILSGNSSIESSFNKSIKTVYASKFTKTVAQATKQLEEGARFELPTIIINNIESVAEDFDTIQQLESSASEWSFIVSHNLEKETRQKPAGNLPMAELDFDPTFRFLNLPFFCRSLS